jgi:hypothetical protein
MLALTQLRAVLLQVEARASSAVIGEKTRPLDQRIHFSELSPCRQMNTKNVASAARTPTGRRIRRGFRGVAVRAAMRKAKLRKQLRAFAEG